MSELADIILRGTDQMVSGVHDSRQAKIQKEERDRVALETVANTAVDTFKQHKSWADAKVAEEEIANLTKARVLGLAQGGPKAALEAYSNIPVSKAVSAKFLSDISTKDSDNLGTEMDHKLKEAQISHYRSQDAEAQAKRKQLEDVVAGRAEILKQHPVMPDDTPLDTEMRTMFLSGDLPPAQYVSYLSQRTSIKKEQDKQAAMTARAAANRAAIAAEGEKNRKTSIDVAGINKSAKVDVATKFAETADKDRALRESIANSRLEFDKTNAENAQAIKVFTQEWVQEYGQARLALATDANARANALAVLESERKQLGLDRLTALMNGWNKDEDKKELLESIDDSMSTMDQLLSDLKTMSANSPAPTPMVEPPVLKPFKDGTDGSSKVETQDSPLGKLTKQPDGTWKLVK